MPTMTEVLEMAVEDYPDDPALQAELQTTLAFRRALAVHREQVAQADAIVGAIVARNHHLPKAQRVDPFNGIVPKGV